MLVTLDVLAAAGTHEVAHSARHRGIYGTSQPGLAHIADAALQDVWASAGNKNSSVVGTRHT